MKGLRVFASLCAIPLLWSGASAQELSPTYPPTADKSIPNEWIKFPLFQAPLAKPAQGAPLALRSGAVPNGLQGFYDYQSNGMSPSWIQVNPSDPDEIHMTYMLSVDGSSVETVGSSRRVGYTRSTDGGQSWTPTIDVSGEGRRLGFPHLGWVDFGAGPATLIATHGDIDNSGVRTLFYGDVTGQGDISYIFPMNRTAPSNRSGEDGAGVIWPAFASHTDLTNQTVVASLSFREGEDPAPLNVATANAGEGTTSAWKDLSSDSIASATSGGRYVVDVAPSGKIGVVYHQTMDFDGDFYSTIRITESVDNGATWSEPQIIIIRDTTTVTNENGNLDTLSPRSNIDFAYMGEDPQVVFGGTINFLYKYWSIYHWSGSSGKVSRIATTDIDSLRGIELYNARLSQPGDLVGLCYPTISVGDDGQHIVVAYMAMGQFDSDDDPLNQTLQLVNGPDGFGYFRVWMVGSADGGQSWGANHILQDWADASGETDSASIEYPSLNKTCRVDEESGNVEIDMAFQARRTPGMYAFIVDDIDGNGTDANRGAITECFQYFQRTNLSSDMFNSSLSVNDKTETAAAKKGNIRCAPNPAASTASILFSTPQAGATSMKIYDALGREVMTVVDNERLYAASHLREIKLDSLVPGSYTVVLSQGGIIATQQLQVVR